MCNNTFLTFDTFNEDQATALATIKVRVELNGSEDRRKFLGSGMVSFLVLEYLARLIIRSSFTSIVTLLFTMIERSWLLT